jgi:ADP-ribosylglycohydrolase
MMDSTAEARLARAYVALVGLWVGDAYGSFFESGPFGAAQPYLDGRMQLLGEWPYTDDTNMAMSIYRLLHQHGEINQDLLAWEFADRYEESRNYGLGSRKLLAQISAGTPWREASMNLFNGGSYGNGGAMRVAPLGAYFADDLPLCIEQARLTCEITHAHVEGIAGGIAVAVATALACHYREQGERPSRRAFIDAVLPYVPAGEISIGLERARDLPLGFDHLKSAVQALTTLGRGWETAQDCVPLVLWCAGEALDNYPLAIEQILLAGGDTDTNAAMVGGIAASFLGEAAVPLKWRSRVEAMPRWAFETTP